MTILGKHTVADVQSLGKDLDYQFNQVNEAFKSIDPKWIASNREAYTDLTHNWTAARQKWANDSLSVKGTLGIKMGAVGIMVSPTIVPAEDEWNVLLSNTAQGGRNGDDSLYGVNARIQEIRNAKTDFQNRPNQIDAAGTDWDFAAFRKIDGAIKKGETAVKDAAKSNKGLLIAGGVGLVVAGVIAGKVYL